MSFWGCLNDVLSCAGKHASSAVVNSTVPAAWDAICKSFASAATEVLSEFGKSFVSIPDVNPTDPGISRAYAATLSIGALVAALLVIAGTLRTVLTADGKPMAQAAIGIAKAVVAWMATASVATAALWASNDLSNWIVGKTLGSQAALVVRLGQAVNWSGLAGAAGQASAAASLILIIAIVGIILVAVLWLELLFRNAALALLIVGSPVSAAGQINDKTGEWWPRLVTAAAQLIVLKPVVALVFGIGFSMTGGSKGIESVLEGILVLAMAVFAWPIVARFFTFANFQSATSGLALAMGFVAGRMAGGGQGGPSGIDPRQWSQAAEQRNTTTPGGGEAGGGGPGAGPPAGGGPAGPSGGPGGGSASSGGGGSAVLAGIGTALAAAHRAGTFMAAGLEQAAAHGGMQGAYPYSTVGNGGSRGPSPRGRRAAPPPSTSGPGGQRTSSSSRPEDPGAPDENNDRQAPHDPQVLPPDRTTASPDFPEEPPVPPDAPDDRRDPPDPPDFRPY